MWLTYQDCSPSQESSCFKWYKLVWRLCIYYTTPTVETRLGKWTVTVPTKVSWNGAQNSNWTHAVWLAFLSEMTCSKHTSVVHQHNSMVNWFTLWKSEAPEQYRTCRGVIQYVSCHMMTLALCSYGSKIVDYCLRMSVKLTLNVAWQNNGLMSSSQPRQRNTVVVSAFTNTNHSALCCTQISCNHHFHIFLRLC